MTLYGVDLSNNNWGGKAPNAIVSTLNEIASEGFAWIEHKVSEGDYYADPYWPVVWQWSQTTNIPVVGYHYVTTNDPTGQAHTYLSNDPSGGKAPCMLDFEANSGDIANFWNVWNAFVAAGINMRLSYVPHWYWQEIGSPDLSRVAGLVSSSYVGGSGYASVLYPGAGWSGWSPYGGATPAICQFTDSAMVAGMSVDANAFEGDETALTQLFGMQPKGPLMALTDDQQQQLFDAVLDIQTQLRGPGLGGWPQLGVNAAGDSLTVVDALAAVKAGVTRQSASAS